MEAVHLYIVHTPSHHRETNGVRRHEDPTYIPYRRDVLRRLGHFPLQGSLRYLWFGAHQVGLAQGRLYQLAAYILSIAVFAIVIAARYNWRNERQGYWLNLVVVGWADAIWVAVVVLPGYVDMFRGLLPPAIYMAGALLTTYAQRQRSTRI